MTLPVRRRRRSHRGTACRPRRRGSRRPGCSGCSRRRAKTMTAPASAASAATRDRFSSASSSEDFHEAPAPTAVEPADAGATKGMKLTRVPATGSAAGDDGPVSSKTAPVTSAAPPTIAEVMAMAFSRRPLVSTEGSNTLPAFDWALTVSALLLAARPSKPASTRPLAPTTISEMMAIMRPLPPLDASGAGGVAGGGVTGVGSVGAAVTGTEGGGGAATAAGGGGGVAAGAGGGGGAGGGCGRSGRRRRGRRRCGRRRRRGPRLIVEFQLRDLLFDVRLVGRVGRPLQEALVETHRLARLLVEAVGLRDVEQHRWVAADLVDLGVLVDRVGVLPDVVGALPLFVVRLHLLLLLSREGGCRLSQSASEPASGPGHQNRWSSQGNHDQSRPDAQPATARASRGRGRHDRGRYYSGPPPFL